MFCTAALSDVFGFSFVFISYMFGAELSTDNDLVVSCGEFRCQVRVLDRPGAPKWIMNVRWEHRQGSQSVRPSTPTSNRAQQHYDRGCGHWVWMDHVPQLNLWPPHCWVWWSFPNQMADTPDEGIRQTEERVRAWLTCGTAEAADRYQQALRSVALKLGCGRRHLISLKAILANCCIITALILFKFCKITKFLFIYFKSSFDFFRFQLLKVFYHP